MWNTYDPKFSSESHTDQFPGTNTRESLEIWTFSNCSHKLEAAVATGGSGNLWLCLLQVLCLAESSDLLPKLFPPATQNTSSFCPCSGCGASILGLQQLFVIRLLFKSNRSDKFRRITVFRAVYSGTICKIFLGINLSGATWWLILDHLFWDIFPPSFLNFCWSTEDSPSWPRLYGRGVMIPLLTFDGLNARQVNKEDWFCLDSTIWY